MRIGFVPAAEPISRLMEELGKLPGIGPKSAARLAYFLLRMPEADARALAEAIIAVKEKTVLCSLCQNITDSDPCAICTSEERDPSTICVVEEPKDVLVIEKSGLYQGSYHVLLGTISPLEGVKPEDLKTKELLARIKQNEVREIIIATDSDAEGETTALYLARLIKPLGVKTTRIACGIPAGGNLEYADQATLGKALEGRQEV